MHRIAIILVLLLIAACDTPGRGFAGIAPQRVEAGGAVFDLRRKGDIVEAIRVSKHAWPRYDWVAVRAARASQRATGCAPRWARGDPSVMRLGLSCDGRPAPKIPEGPNVLHCEVTGYRVPTTDMAEGTMICS